jgi:hypothetical protein
MDEASTKGLYVALKRGVAVRGRRVYRLLGRMRTLCPWLAESDGPACRAWAEMEISAAVIYGRLRYEGAVTSAGEPRRLLGEYRSIRAAQLSIARELGLTPAARKTLASTGKGFDLAAEFAALNAREVEPAGVAENAPKPTCAP